ncbi:hypothetical protein DFH07DRAFT_964455 [Mycena maculata]|uniref:Uncharacterized protein n=1 Tax=Mycena maculata TaxID=230809 RepID=A0AAD7N344_9AGAR|nr:hypothetical protein DFH07DRAFT_964455 [Mycena maculata]
MALTTGRSARRESHSNLFASCAGWLKDQVETILSPGKDDIAILDLMKNIHPVLGAVTNIFTVRDQVLAFINLQNPNERAITASRLEYDALARLRREAMDDGTEQEYAPVRLLKAHLVKPNYELDSKEAVMAVLDTHRVQVLVLRRHKKIIDFDSHLVLEELEFETMVECVENVAGAFETRFRNLLESWRQQRLDTKLQEGERHSAVWGPAAAFQGRNAEAGKELEAKKAKKGAKKKARNEAPVPLTDSDSDVEKTSYKAPAKKRSSYSYETKGVNTARRGRRLRAAMDTILTWVPARSATPPPNYLWESEDEFDSGSSSDSSASDFVTRKVKKPKIDDRITDLEDQLSEM